MSGVLDHQRRHDHRLDQRLHLGQGLGRAGDLGADPPGGHGGAGQVRDQQRGPLDRHMLKHHQVHRDRPQVRSVTGRGVDPGRRGRHRHRPAPADPLMHPVLGDRRRDQRHVPDLANHHPHLLGPIEATAAAGARCRDMVDHLVRVGHQSQPGPRRARLLARLTRRPRPAVPLGLDEPVRGRRQRGVPRVLTQPPGQLSDLPGQRFDLCVLPDSPSLQRLQLRGLRDDHSKQLLARHRLPLGHTTMIGPSPLRSSRHTGHPPHETHPSHRRHLNGYYLPACGNRPGSADADALCGVAVAGCQDRAGSGPLTVIWRRTYVDARLVEDWVSVDYTCFPDAVQAAPRPMLTLAMVQAAFHRTAWARVGVSMQPVNNVTLVRLPNYYRVVWSVSGFEPGEVDAVDPGAMLGNRVELRPRLVGVVYRYGDGTTAGPTLDLGGGYPSGTVTHAYPVPGTYTVRVDAVMSADFRVNGGGWEPLPDEVTLTGIPSPMTVATARAVLIK